MLRTLSIGDLHLPFPFILAPMAGVSDLAHRLISRSFGATLAFTEMVSARALKYGNKRCRDMLASVDADRPLGVQLVAGDQESILAALEVLERHRFDVIDLNAACPVSKIVRRGEGAGLLKEPQRLQQLISLLVQRSGKPVTLKIRAGWDAASINAVEIARMAEDAGVAAVCVHGRTRVQGYDGAVDYGVIRKVKEAVAIPVVGSGDVFSGELAMKMFGETGCDGVAVARGSMGNPWIFGEITELLCHGTVPARPSKDEVISTMRDHLRLSMTLLGETLGVLTFRKFFVWYSHGFAKVRPLRTKALQARSIGEMLGVIEELRTTQSEC
ncbi:MAG TPA: tRNA dihydrouridine synthase DusB [Syntrophorhabdales bacterium]|nr:tRNA dihydrouridine synthase DusB [Syntrophorhabdales bacterium]